MFEDIRNELEDVVQIELVHAWKTNQHCRCEQCLGDVYALALNSLQPHYRNNEEGSIYMHINGQQKKVEVISAIADAMRIVGEHPRHGKE